MQGDAQLPNGGPTIPLASCHSQLPDLRLCLDFEDVTLDPVIADLSAGSHNASASSIDPVTRAGQQAAALDYGSSIQIPESPDLDIPMNLTIEMWLAPDDGQSTSYPLANTPQYALGLEGGKLRCELGTHSLDSSTTIPPHVWTHVACTFDGTTIKSYIGGSVNTCKGFAPSTIGNFNTTGTTLGLAYAGGLDDVHVYARTLDDHQIQTLAGVQTASTMCKPGE